MRGAMWSCVLVAGFGCSDTSLKTVNNAPTALITSHSDGAEVLETEVLRLIGRVSDTDHHAEDLTATWYINGEAVCPDQTPLDDGTTVCESTVSGGALEVKIGRASCRERV